MLRIRSLVSHFLPLCALQTWILQTAVAEPQLAQQGRVHSVEDQHPFRGPQSLLTLHRDLVRIESITGNENAVGSFLADYLADHNFTVQKQVVESPQANGWSASCGVANAAERFNILAFRGGSPKSRVLVSSHIDTVPPYWPYEVRNHDDIWGRGTVDAKGSVAAQIIAVEELLHAGDLHEGDVALLFVVGEETGGDGMRKANDLGLSWETAIFGEPTELKLASGHKGNLGFKISAKGKAAHSGYPWLGESANSMLIPALAALDKLELPSSEKYGNTTINIGRMEGGVAANVIPETAFARIAIRLASGTPEDAKKIVRDTIGKIDDRLEFEFSGRGYGPVDIDSDVEGRYTGDRILTFLTHPVDSLTGFDTIVVNYGTDIPNLEGDHKRYLYGPGNILVAHSDHEHLTVADLEEAVVGYKKLIQFALNR
ncbi:hypothetical protein MMC19_007795 [Ptychographa xylographoides]|nr:hypothetical protein [Ptychographa xylographoides]